MKKHEENSKQKYAKMQKKNQKIFGEEARQASHKQ